MAGQISHIVAGEGALDLAERSGQGWPWGEAGALGAAAAYFRLGCQGPDIFYHNQRTMPSGLHYGSLAHRRRFGSLVAGAAEALAKGDRSIASPAGAYILGLATHAAVDRATHPFIIYFSGWADPSDPSSERRRGAHSFLERVLDLGLLERRLGLGSAGFGLSARLGLREGEPAAPDPEAEAAVEAAWAAGLRRAYPTSTGSDSALPARIANALSDARHFYGLTDPEATASGGAGYEWLRRLGPEQARRLISVVYPLRLPEGMDAMNETGEEWLHPSGDGRRSRASYPELIDEGSRAAALAVASVLGLWRGELSAEALSAAIGEGGLALCDAAGAPLPPRLSRPLALPEAMDAEYAARMKRGRH